MSEEALLPIVEENLELFMLLPFVIYGVIIIAWIVIWWKLFDKADKPGWLTLIPVVNVYQWSMIVCESIMPLLMILGIFALMLIGTVIPFLLIVAYIVAIAFNIWFSFKIAAAYGEGTAFGLLIAFVPFIGLAVLAFGNYVYVGVESEYDGCLSYNGEQHFDQNQYNQMGNQDDYAPVGYDPMEFYNDQPKQQMPNQMQQQMPPQRQPRMDSNSYQQAPQQRYPQEQMYQQRPQAMPQNTPQGYQQMPQGMNSQGYQEFGNQNYPQRPQQGYSQRQPQNYPPPQRQPLSKNLDWGIDDEDYTPGGYNPLDF